nr:SDR family oxidoreductase [Szabonella alba]
MGHGAGRIGVAALHLRAVQPDARGGGGVPAGLCGLYRSTGAAVTAASGLALVTGAGRRLGRAMALYLAGRGFDLALHCHGSRDDAETLAVEIRAMGRRAGVFAADLLEEAEVAALLPAVLAEMGGPVTLLVNNASIFEHDDITSATRLSWDRHFGSNLRAPFVLTQALAAQDLPDLRDAEGERLAGALIVNMIDQRVLKPVPDYMTYGIAKAGLWAMTRMTAQALAPRIRVNAIGPGPTLQGGRQSAEQFRAQRATTILGRGAALADICAALGFFIDSPAVTGQLICADGGQHLDWRTPDVTGLE